MENSKESRVQQKNGDARSRERMTGVGGGGLGV